MPCLNNRSYLLAGACASFPIMLSGCMTAELQESRNTTTAITAHEAVVLLAKPHVEGVTAEDEFMDCVGNKMAASGKIRVQPNDAFVDSMFPWFEPSTAPQRPEGVTKLLARDVVAERIAESGVRYLIWVTARPARPTAAARLPARSARPVAAASASAGGKRNQTTKRSSGTSARRAPRARFRRTWSAPPRWSACWCLCPSSPASRAPPATGWRPSSAASSTARIPPLPAGEPDHISSHGG